ADVPVENTADDANIAVVGESTEEDCSPQFDQQTGDGDETDFIDDVLENTGDDNTIVVINVTINKNANGKDSIEVTSNQDILETSEVA
ncbi:hypothetical protein BC833DRAFT_626778, partial [Globomyces pollinis-pini]